MKNILGTTEDLTFYNKEGVKVYDFNTNFNGSKFSKRSIKRNFNK